jgi:Na+/H+ antiporter NhaD/arsenite permease-like protein
MLAFSQGPVLWQMIAAIVIVGIGFLLILVEAWNRTLVAIAGALLLIIIGAVPISHLNTYIYWELILLLIVVYVVTLCIQRWGIVQYAAMKLIHQTNAKPIHIMITLVLLAAFGSALMDGLMMMVILIPFTITVARLVKLSPLPFLIGEMLASNIGGTATWIGNMPNRMIAVSNHLTYLDFITTLGPLVLILLAVLLLFLSVVYGKRFILSEKQKKELLVISPASYMNKLPFVFKGKEAVVSIKNNGIAWLWQGIMDSQVLFFIGLFTMVGALIHTGVIGLIAERALEITQGSVPFLSMLVLWLSGLGSATLDQVPYTATMIPIVQEMGTMLELTEDSFKTLWWSLAIGAGIGGGGTLIGSQVNVLAAGAAMRERSVLAFWEYTKVAAPLTLIMLIISSFYMYFINY